MQQFFFHLSETESNLLGLKIGRGEFLLSAEMEEGLAADIIRNKWDICRLKTNGFNEQIFHILDRIAVPWNIFSINYLNEKKTGTEPFFSNELEAVLYSGEQEEELISILKIILQSKGWFEYYNELYQELLDKRKQKALALEYFSSFHEKKRKNGRTWLLKRNGQTVGTFMGEAKDDTFYGTLYGILPQFRNEGLSKDIYRFMDDLCRQNGWKVFYNDINIFNVPSQRSAARMELVPSEIRYNIILYPMFSKTNHETIDFYINAGDDFIQGVLNKTFSILKGFNLTEIKFSRNFNKENGVNVRLTFPVINETNAWCSLIINSKTENNNSYGYLRFSR